METGDVLPSIEELELVYEGEPGHDHAVLRGDVESAGMFDEMKALMVNRASLSLLGANTWICDALRCESNVKFLTMNVYRTWSRFASRTLFEHMTSSVAALKKNRSCRICSRSWGGHDFRQGSLIGFNLRV